MISSHCLGFVMILWAPCKSFRHSFPKSRKNSVQYHMKVVYSVSDKSEGYTILSNHC
jgi:hypothetical protein